MVVVFYPGDNTPVCTRQLNSYNDELAQFADVGAQVLAISAQDVDSHDQFSDRHGFGFPLLADTDKEVARAWGVLGPLGFVRRSVFIVDGEGTIRYAHRIVVLVGGAIAEMGTAKELLARRGYFADLVRKQQLEEEIEAL